MVKAAPRQENEAASPVATPTFAGDFAANGFRRVKSNKLVVLRTFTANVNQPVQ